MKLTKENLKSQLNDKKNHWTNYRNITWRTIETSTNGYKDHRKYETVIVSSGSVWTIIIQINFIKQYKM
jgi:hypothetical protein